MSILVQQLACEYINILQMRNDSLCLGWDVTMKKKERELIKMSLIRKIHRIYFFVGRDMDVK